MGHYYSEIPDYVVGKSLGDLLVTYTDFQELPVMFVVSPHHGRIYDLLRECDECIVNHTPEEQCLADTWSLISDISTICHCRSKYIDDNDCQTIVSEELNDPIDFEYMRNSEVDVFIDLICNFDISVNRNYEQVVSIGFAL